MAAQDGNDYEAFQRLSDTYQPNVEGPLIRERCSIQNLLQEYASADPTYVRKTGALAASYSHYRPVKGDGQCGWRALVYGYFENIIAQGLQKIHDEMARIQTFNNDIVRCGYEMSILEFFVEETTDLFASISMAVQSGNPTEPLLLDVFNDEGKGNAILFHFRLLTSTTMKLNPNQYQPYLEHPVEEFCRNTIDAVGQEIEQIGLQALTDGVIAPAAINVRVLYLDRSEGDEVTQHTFVANAPAIGPEITLLYRPGHYDMIYKAPPLQVRLTLLQPEQSQFVPSGNHYEASAKDYRLLSAFDENSSLVHDYSSAHYPSSGHNVAFSPLTAYGQDHSADAYSGYVVPTPTYTQPISSNQASFGTTSEVCEAPEVVGYSPYSGSDTSYTSCHPPMLSAQTYSSSPLTSPVAAVAPPSGFGASKQDLQIRICQSCYDFTQSSHNILPLETSPFKNSPFNRGHFKNPDFQPMMWEAEKEYN